MIHLGIVGLRSCGKTSLFKALAPGKAGDAAVRGKREINIGQAKVHDPRLDELTAIFKPKKQLNATVEYVDLVGYSREDASKNGFEGRFLGEIRACDTLVHVLRKFEAPGLLDPDPARDFLITEQEFLISDQIIFEKRLERLDKESKKKPLAPEMKMETELLRRCLEALEQEKPLRTLNFSAEEEIILRPFQPLTLKQELVVINVGEDDIQELYAAISHYQEILRSPGVIISAVCATIEQEIAELDAVSAREFMDDLGIKKLALNRLIQASYSLMGLISFFTVGSDECRAWTIRQGTTAREAAGTVHSDMERGFIRADVVNFTDFQPRGSMALCRTDGVRKLEGKDYIVQDGDIIEFRFAV